MADAEKTRSQPSFRGSCACGRLNYQCSSAPRESTTACHCVTCRKLAGGPYQAFSHVTAESLTYFDQKEHLRYEGLPKDNIGGIVYLRLSKAAERAFCASCYTPLAMRYKHQPGIVAVALGSIDEDSISSSHVKKLLGLDSHIFTSQKAWWMDFAKDDLPKHERFPGSFEEDLKARCENAL